MARFDLAAFVDALRRAVDAVVERDRPDAIAVALDPACAPRVERLVRGTDSECRLWIT
jgi:hypothetical protein